MQTLDIFLVFLVVKRQKCASEAGKWPHALVPGIGKRQGVSEAGSCGGQQERRLTVESEWETSTDTNF